jgi:hypothetical protein
MNRANGTDPEIIEGEVLIGPLSDFIKKVVREKEKTETKWLKTIEHQLKLNRQLNPIDVRHGFLGLGKNQRDVAQYEAARDVADLARSFGFVLGNTVKLGDYSHQIGTELAERLFERDQELPDEVQQFGQLLTRLILQETRLSIGEMIQLFPRLSRERILRAFEEAK